MIRNINITRAHTTKARYKLGYTHRCARGKKTIYREEDQAYDDDIREPRLVLTLSIRSPLGLMKLTM